MRKDLTEAYRQLPPEQLFPLVVEADDRGDEQERLRIIDAAPRVLVHTVASALRDRLLGCLELAAVLGLDVSPWLGWLEALHVVGEMARLEGHPVRSPHAEMHEAARARAAKEILTRWAGFRAAVEEEAGIPADMALRVFLPPLAVHLDRWRGVLDEAEADPAKAEEYADGLRKLWRVALRLERPVVPDP
jgi:hypothetical protein